MTHRIYVGGDYLETYVKSGCLRGLRNHRWVNVKVPLEYDKDKHELRSTMSKEEIEKKFNVIL